MTAALIDGKKLASIVRGQVANKVKTLSVAPGLATILVGDDPASAIYVANKRKACVEAGIVDHHRHLPATATRADVEALIDELNADPGVNGILLQLPLPPHLDARSLIAWIDPDKDVDGLTAVSAGRLSLAQAGLRPCTPSGVVRLLDWAGVSIAGAHAVVIGRSDLVGRPLAQMLLRRDATVTICHSRTSNLRAIARRADILVAAAGVPRIVAGDHVKLGAAVIDVGIHRTDSGLCGDVDFDSVSSIAGMITPVPGGVGPMTIASLLENTVRAAQLQTVGAGPLQ